MPRRAPVLLAAVLLAALPAAAHADTHVSVLRTSDAEGVAVNRVAVRATPEGSGLRVHAFVVARALGGPRTLTLRIGRSAVAADIAPAETRLTVTRIVRRPADGAALVVRLGARSLRLVLTSRAWSAQEPSWYGLKTPESLWGGDVFRAVDVRGRAAAGGAVGVHLRARLAGLADTTLGGILGTLGADGDWTVAAQARADTAGAVAADASAPPMTTLSGDAVAQPPFRAAGYGLFATQDTAPLMIVWLPPPGA